MGVRFLKEVLCIICQAAVQLIVECHIKWSTKPCLGESYLWVRNNDLFKLWCNNDFRNWYFFPDPCIKFYNLMTVYFILLIFVIVFMNGSIIYIMSDRSGIHTPPILRLVFLIVTLFNPLNRRAAANWNIRVFKISLATSGTDNQIRVSRTLYSFGWPLDCVRDSRFCYYFSRFTNRWIYSSDCSCSTSLCCQKATSVLVHGFRFTHCKYSKDSSSFWP